MKPVRWGGSSKKELLAFPESVKDAIGYALYLAQKGETHPDTKALKGFHGASVLEVIEDIRGNTYRAVYTVRYRDAIWVLHAFQKKSKHGIATPPEVLELVRQRLAELERAYRKKRGMERT